MPLPLLSYINTTKCYGPTQVLIKGKLKLFTQPQKKKIRILLIKMGGSFSNLENNVDHFRRSSSSLLQYQPQLQSSSRIIITFHSSAKWKAHFDASKSTNKLVIFPYKLFIVPLICLYLNCQIFCWVLNEI